MNNFKTGSLSKDDIRQWLADLRARAYVPFSDYAVSAVLRTPDNVYFAGVNVENADHRLSTHGEEGAISAMTTALGKSSAIAELWVMAAPRQTPQEQLPLGTCCGKCRQQIAGFADAGVKIHSLSPDGREMTTTVGEFLPTPFTFRQFMPEALAKKSNTPVRPRDITRTGNLSDADIKTWLQDLESFDVATGEPQSVVLKLENNFYVAGVKVEDAAFVSISAAQNALANAVTLYSAQKIDTIYVAHEDLSLSEQQIFIDHVTDKTKIIRLI